MPIERAIWHLPLVWVHDNAIESISHGRDVAVPGVCRLHNDINPEDIVGVMSMADELVAIGTAQLPSLKILEEEKGIAINTDKVFL